MKVGINLLYLLPGIVGGTETYAAGLLHGLSRIDREDEFVVFVNQESAEWPLPKAANFTRVICPIRATSRMGRYAFEQVKLPGLLRRHGVDIVHSLGYVAPLFPPCPSVVTIADLNYRAFGTQMRAHHRLTLQFFVSQSALRARTVVTISDYSRSSIIDEFSLPAGKVLSAHLAPKLSEPDADHPEEAERIRRELGVKSPYLLAFSSQSPNKNIPRLVEAFRHSTQQHKLPHQLVLVGHPCRMEPSAQQLDGGGERIVSTGYISDRSLRAVLKGAQALVFPSIYEGFGLPVLEAMQAGVPVACSDRASLPEVAGKAALFFDPISIEAMADRISELALNPNLREQMRTRGFENVKRFSWEKTARETLSVYHELQLQEHQNTSGV